MAAVIGPLLRIAGWRRLFAMLDAGPLYRLPAECHEDVDYGRDGADRRASIGAELQPRPRPGQLAAGSLLNPPCRTRQGHEPELWPAAPSTCRRGRASNRRQRRTGAMERLDREEMLQRLRNINENARRCPSTIPDPPSA
jgi:hypothetical protein